MPPGLNNVVAISAGDSFSLALKQNGELVAWGISDSGQTIVPMKDVVAAAAGGRHGLLLRQRRPATCLGTRFEGPTFVPPV